MRKDTHLRLHCYIAIELKTGMSKPEHTGKNKVYKIDFYLAPVMSFLFMAPQTSTTGDSVLDPRLAQRLIGAAVITALAVIFVPELVEQRKPPGVTSANTAPLSTPDAPRHV